MSATQREAKHRRPLTFGAVGITSMLVGSYGTLFACVELLGINPVLAYAFQAVVAIELNFLLNHLITWRDRPARGRALWQRWLKFNGTRFLVTVPLNQVLFTLLVGVFGAGYLVANTACIIVTTVFNYVVGEKYVFVPEPINSTERTA